MTGVHITGVEAGRDAASIVDAGKKREACPIGEEVTGVLQVFQLLDDDLAMFGWISSHLIARNPAADAVLYQRRVVQSDSSAIRSSQQRADCYQLVGVCIRHLSAFLAHGVDRTRRVEFRAMARRLPRQRWSTIVSASTVTG